MGLKLVSSGIAQTRTLQRFSIKPNPFSGRWLHPAKPCSLRKFFFPVVKLHLFCLVIFILCTRKIYGGKLYCGYKDSNSI